MECCIRIFYTTDDNMDALWEGSVHESIVTTLNTILPYMVDNVDVYFEANGEDQED